MAEVGDDGPDEPAVGSGDGNERHHRAPHGTRRTTGGLVDDEGFPRSDIDIPSRTSSPSAASFLNCEMITSILLAKLRRIWSFYTQQSCQRVSNQPHSSLIQQLHYALGYLKVNQWKRIL